MSKPQVICDGDRIVSMPTFVIKSLVRDTMQNLHGAWHRVATVKSRGLDASSAETAYRAAQKDWKTVCSLPGCDRRLVRSIVTKYYWRKRHWRSGSYPTEPAPALRRAMAG